MKDAHDLSAITEGWPYRQGEIHARRLEGADGKPRLQLRVDLGVLQMEVEGRPDGRRPHGYRSLLDYLRSLERTTAAAGRRPLSAAECAELQQEAVQFYYRYLAWSSLEEWDGVVRDTTHNLELMELVRRRVPDAQTAWQFLQFYPYLRMMNAQAWAQKRLMSGHNDTAVKAIEEGLADIRRFAAEHGLEDTPARMQEIRALTDLLLSIQTRQPASRSEALRAELQEAIESEDFERAATLRDQLRRLV